ncbi:heme-binding domain-containing protein [Lutibacter sp.]|uniref:heme-binding domain-containing protein n=1 Tax=Lutibacter sp. TaxID=1925666 RepID=UPI003566BBD4
MKKVLLIMLVLVVVMQFIRPEKNNSKDYTNDISTVVHVPNDVQEILKTSCADCHSNNTVYPWYSEIAPVSWYLASHVNDGKKHLNFSEWTSYNQNQQSHIKKDLEEVMEENEMPLKSYLIVHKDAKLSAKQHEILSNWIQTINVK